MTVGDPNWDLLPGDPLAFFRLQPDFERGDLRRAYTRLIRVYKPEQSPAEFQRIRAAYEALDERLRYLGAARSSLEVIAAPLRESKQGAAKPIDTLLLLDNAGVLGARDALRSRPDLDGRGWCQLALIEDVLNQEPRVFHRALIEGIVQTGGATEPVRLLHSLLHQQLPPKLAAGILGELLVLVKGSKAPLTPAMYWFLTEPVWIDLAVRLKFESFAALLARCSESLGEDAWHGRLVLLTTLIRRCAIRADQKWIESTMAELERSYNHLSAWHQSDVDLVAWLLDYRRQRDAFRAPLGFREILDRALVAIVEGDEVRADFAFLEAQVACLDRPDELFESFPPGERSGMVIEVLQWYAGEVATRRGARTDLEGDSRIGRSISDFSRRVARRTGRSPFNLINATLTGWVAILLLSMAVLPFFLPQRIGVESRLLLFGIPILTTSLVLLALGKGWIGALFAFVERPFLRLMHIRIWRGMTKDFLAETHIPLEQIQGVLESSQSSHGHLADFRQHVGRDEALFLYSIAIQFAE